MNTKKINKLLYLLSLLLLAGIQWSCLDDRDDYGSSGRSGERTVTFSVRVPGTSAPSTYALDAADENEVKTIEVLLFKNGNYYHIAYSNTITTNPSDSRIKTFSVQIPEGTYDMVILANARKSVADILSGVTINDSKNSVVSRLLLTNTGKWNSNPSSGDYIAIPMWGEITSLTVNASTPANNPVALLRILSKIDVALTTTDASSKFKLQSVRLYNYNNRGQVAPDASNWNPAQNTVTAPSVPSSAQKPADPAQSPLVYTGSEITTADLSCIGEIYTFESAAGTSAALQDNSCLVIGGIYAGDSQPTYYRVDFARTTVTGGSSSVSYLALLRNHRYKVNITDVKAPGFSNPADAFNSRPVNITAEIIEWDDAGISDIEFDGQFMLGASKGKFDFTKNAYTVSDEGNTVSITTDYKSNDGSVQGWKVSSIVDASGQEITDWLKTSVKSGNANVSTEMKIVLTENNSGQERKGYIHISAGRLTYVIEVNQSLIPALDLVLKNMDGEEISELVFSGQTAGIAPAAQKFTASWLPLDKECSVTSTALGGNAFSFLSGSDTPGQGAFTTTSSGGLGKQVYTIAPAAFTQSEIDANPMLEKSSKIDFLVSNGIGFKSKTIYLRHIHYGLKATLNEIYLLNGSQQSINIKSNSLWKVRNVDDPQSLLVSFNMNQNGGYNVQTGDTFYFTLRQINSSSDLNSSITFLFYDPTGKYTDVAVVIHPTGCGMNGVAGSLKIGTRTYLTHAYNGKCWMVENLQEGSPDAQYYRGPITGTTSGLSSTYYPSTSNGQRYYGSSSGTACPAGWHLPTAEEAAALITYIKADIINGGTHGAQWWAGTSATGYQSNNDNVTFTGGAFLNNPGPPSYYWRYWSEQGFWWIEAGSNLRGDNTKIDLQSHNATKAFLSVRCVRD